MRDIILAIFAIAIVAGSAMLIIPIGAGTAAADDRIVLKEKRDRATADELETWAAKLER